MYTGYYTFWKSTGDLVNKQTAILFGIIAIAHSDRKQMLCLFHQKKAVRFKYSADLSCPLCPNMDNALHMLSGCQHSTIRTMITERHNMANRKTITALTKSVHGANIVYTDIESAAKLAHECVGTTAIANKCFLPVCYLACQTKLYAPPPDQTLYSFYARVHLTNT
jgi:hypothetical protein